jgi:hypothetical protein
MAAMCEAEITTAFVLPAPQIRALHPDDLRDSKTMFTGPTVKRMVRMTGASRIVRVAVLVTGAVSAIFGLAPTAAADTVIDLT